MKTAVDEVLKWVKDELQLFGSAKQILIDKLNQAKEMEKEQIIESYSSGYTDSSNKYRFNRDYYNTKYTLKQE